MTNTTPLPLLKILYIDPSIGYRSNSSEVLESSIGSLLTHTCVFTVVPTGYLALESTQYSCYDVIIIDSKLPDLETRQFFHILSEVGVNVRVIMMVSPTIAVADDRDILQAEQ